jgi:signal transduction histidine kinase
MDSVTASARPPRAKRGLRQRIALAFAVLCSTVAAIQGAVAYFTVEGEEDAMSNAIVEQEMEAFARRHAEGSRTAPSSSRMRGYTVTGPADAERLPDFARTLEGGPREVYADGRTYHVMSRAVGDDRLVVVLDASAHEERIDAFRRFVVFSILACSLLALLLGHLLARRLVRPLEQLTGSLQKLAPGEGGQTGGDEATRLLDAFDRYQRQVSQLLAQERQFASNASHELRTPLTALRTSCELLLLDRRVAGASRARVDDMMRVIDGMTATVSASLQLARDHPATMENLALRDLVEDVLLPLRATFGRGEVALVVDIAPTLHVRADRQALQMVLQNLLRNAFAHTHAGEVRIAAGDGWVEVRDTGVGIAAEDLPRVFDRHFSARRADVPASPGSAGHGIGLALVKQLCDRHGWAVSIRSEARAGHARGTTVRVELDGRTVAGR